MSLSRRRFLQRTSASVLATSLPAMRLFAQRSGLPSYSPDAVPLAVDPATKAFADRALDAARSAGAQYAEVHQHLREQERFSFGDPYPAPYLVFTSGFGIRALYNGYWGYAAVGGVFGPDDAVRCGRDAVALAKNGARGKPRTVDLAPTSNAQGSWTTPLDIDPFAVEWGEKIDVANGYAQYVKEQGPEFGGGGNFGFFKHQKSFASTEGASLAQTQYLTTFEFSVSALGRWPGGYASELGGQREVGYFNAAAAGWEYVLRSPIETQIEPCLRQAQDARFRRPIEVGRYDIVFDSHAMANQIHLNLAAATQLERAMGYGANSVGTSFLNDPASMLGNYKVGSSLLTLTANRSLPGGCATVKWDDEGVTPDDAALVTNGILTDFQTTRESATWLNAYYAKRGKAVRSHGGMVSGNIVEPPRQGFHNLAMAPSTRSATFDDLVSGVKKGLAVFGGRGSNDHQALNAESGGNIVYEIVNGKLGRVYDREVILTRAPDFWRNLAAIGDASTVRRSAPVRWGIVPQYYTITAPAALVTGIAVTTNIRRS